MDRCGYVLYEFCVYLVVELVLLALAVPYLAQAMGGGGCGS